MLALLALLDLRHHPRPRLLAPAHAASAALVPHRAQAPTAHAARLRSAALPTRVRRRLRREVGCCFGHRHAHRPSVIVWARGEGAGKDTIADQARRLAERLRAEHARMNRSGTQQPQWDVASAGPEEEEDSPPSRREFEQGQRELHGFHVEQNDQEISAHFPIPHSTRLCDVKVNLTADHLRVEIGGKEKPVFDGSLFGPISVRDSYWETDSSIDGTKLVVTLVKKTSGTWDLFEANNVDSAFNVSPDNVIRRLRRNKDDAESSLRDARNRMRKYGKILKEKDNLIEETKLSVNFDRTEWKISNLGALALSVADALDKLSELSDAEGFTVEGRHTLRNVTHSLDSALSHTNITRIRRETCEMYDPCYHEVVGWEKGGGNAGMVTSIVEDGYMIDSSYVLRRAKVIVAK